MSTALAWLPEIAWTLTGLYVAWKVYQLVRDVRRAQERARATIAAARGLDVVAEVPPPKPASGAGPPPDFED